MIGIEFAWLASFAVQRKGFTTEARSVRRGPLTSVMSRVHRSVLSVSLWFDLCLNLRKSALILRLRSGRCLRMVGSSHQSVVSSPFTFALLLAGTEGPLGRTLAYHLSLVTLLGVVVGVDGVCVQRPLTAECQRGAKGEGTHEFSNPSSIINPGGPRP